MNLFAYEGTTNIPVDKFTLTLELNFICYNIGAMNLFVYGGTTNILVEKFTLSSKIVKFFYDLLLSETYP